MTIHMRELFPEAITATVESDLQQRHSSLQVEHYHWIDRGKFDFVASLPTELTQIVFDLARTRLASPTSVIAAQAIQLQPGHYTLLRCDEAQPLGQRTTADSPALSATATVQHGPLIDVWLDLSSASSDSAIIYRDSGKAIFAVPQQPRQLAIVSRGSGVRFNHSYHSLQNSDSIVRIHLVLELD